MIEQKAASHISPYRVAQQKSSKFLVFFEKGWVFEFTERTAAELFCDWLNEAYWRGHADARLLRTSLKS
jgi:hypothetical protein